MSMCVTVVPFALPGRYRVTPNLALASHSHALCWRMGNCRSVDTPKPNITPLHTRATLRPRIKFSGGIRCLAARPGASSCEATGIHPCQGCQLSLTCVDKARNADGFRPALFGCAPYARHGQPSTVGYKIRLRTARGNCKDAGQGQPARTETTLRRLGNSRGMRPRFDPLPRAGPARAAGRTPPQAVTASADVQP